jgi:prophage regulatory protein
MNAHRRHAVEASEIVDAKDASSPRNVLATIGSRGERFLRIKEVIAKVGIGRATVYALMNSGRFPRSIKISQRIARWKESDIEQWMKERALGTCASIEQEAAQ